VAVDGDQPGYSVGTSLPEAAQLLARLGAVEGLMLDGGGSTTLVVGSGVANRISDRNGERGVASALVVLGEWGTNIAAASPRPVDPACPPGAVPPAGFGDVGGGGVHRPAIDCVAWWGLTQGRAPGVYAPAATVSRGEMATFIVRLLRAVGVAVPDAAPDAFPDDDGTTHEANIDRLAALGVVGGFGDGTYRPAAPVTRGEMGTFLARAGEAVAGGPLPATADYFEDDSLDTHERNVNAVAQAGIAGGVTPVVFDGRSPVRRDQMATFLARFLALQVAEGRASTPG
jgi:hypothetical protein